jgi:hypothetical protein
VAPTTDESSAIIVRRAGGHGRYDASGREPTEKVIAKWVTSS